MLHLSEEALVLYRYEEASDRAQVEAHLAGCPRCRAELAALDRVLAQVDDNDAPLRESSYGLQVWNAIEGRLEPETRAAPCQPWSGVAWPRSWRHWARWIVPHAALAGTVTAALLVALNLHRPASRPVVTAPQDEVLVGAVEDHLERTGLMLAELNNADEAAVTPDVRAWAEDLASTNRLYRQSAVLAGDARIGRLLDDLERVLIEVANTPEEPGTSEIDGLRGRLDTRGVAFKLRIAGAELRARAPGAPGATADVGL